MPKKKQGSGLFGLAVIGGIVLFLLSRGGGARAGGGGIAGSGRRDLQRESSTAELVGVIDESSGGDTGGGTDSTATATTTTTTTADGGGVIRQEELVAQTSTAISEAGAETPSDPQFRQGSPEIGVTGDPVSASQDLIAGSLRVSRGEPVPEEDAVDRGAIDEEIDETDPAPVKQSRFGGITG